MLTSHPMRRALPLICLPALLALLTGCGSSDTGTAPPPPFDLGKKETVPAGPPFFKKLSPSETGVDFVYRNGEEKGHLSIIESLGGGAGLIDYDGDGLLDIICIGGGDFEKTRADLKDNKLKSTKIYGYPCKLYRNKGNFQFEDVTATVLKKKSPWFYSHGCAVGDYDCDGYSDLVITGYQGIALFHNEPVDKGDPTKDRQLVEVTGPNKPGKPTWGSSAAWGDLDGDGYPELYVCNYGNWSWENHPDCNYDGKTPDVCPPKQFHGLTDSLYQNNRDGTFTDISDTLTLLKSQKTKEGKLELVPDRKGLVRGSSDQSKGLGILIVDVNMDGKPDLYVANDTVDNFLYINHCKPGSFAFQEVGLQVGVARDGRGTQNGSMGLAAGDYDGRGRPSIFVTNYEGEMHALYRNVLQPPKAGRPKSFYFGYMSAPSGVADVGKNFVAWGTTFLDLDNRGKLDLLFVNGHAIHHPKSTTSSRDQTPVLLRNTGEGKMQNYSARGGDYFKEKHRSRGLAAGDLDNDGFIDLVVANMNSKFAIVKNVSPRENHWLGVIPSGSKNQSIVGAHFELTVAGKKQHRFVYGGGSYASAPDQRLVFGLGSATKIDELTVTWPGGEKATWKDLKADQYHSLQSK